MRSTHLVVLTLIPFAACTSAKILRPIPEVEPTAPQIDPDRGGQVRFNVIPPPLAPNAPRVGDDVTTHLANPRAIRELAMPVYPADALAAGVGDFTVVVRVTIGKDGKIADIRTSDRAPSSAGPFFSSFREAVECAVRQWEFAPGLITEEKPGKDLDGDGKVDYVIATRFEHVPVFYHLRFDFTIVNGVGNVSGGMPVSRGDR